MTDLSTYWHHFLERWKAIVGIVLAAIVIAGVTFAVSWRPKSGDLPRVAAVWPERVSASQEGVLQMHISKGSYPARGARVTLYRHKKGAHHELVDEVVDHGLENFDKLSDGTSDSSGLVSITFPTASVDKPEAGKLMVVDNRATVLLHVEHDGKETFLTRSFGGMEDMVMALSFDRPLYQPGQVVKMRAVLVDADSGEPRAGTKVKWEVRAPGGDLLLDEDLATSGAGVTHTEFALAPRGKQGDYTASLKVAGTERVLASRTFEVRPFRLPRYKVDVVSTQPSIDVDRPAEFVVTATYTYGERVAGADVSLDVAALTSSGQTSIQTLTGKTDRNGQAKFDYTPRDLRPGTLINLDARVSLAGRSEEGSGSASIVGKGIGQVEIVRAGRASFHISTPQIGYVIVTDTRGRPLPNVSLEVTLPEDAETKLVELQTDEKGRAKFTWSPRSNTHRLQVRARHEGRNWRSFSVPVRADYRTEIFGTVASVAAVGEKLSVPINRMVNPGALVLVRRGLPVASVPVPSSSSGQTLEITPPTTARGMSYLVLMGQGNQHIDSLPIWVKQRGGDKVSVTIPGEDHRPGTQASVNLAFPPSADGKSGAEAPVTFGLVGVDEALYALKERAEAPLWSVLRQEPESLGSVVSMISAVDAGDEAAVDIASARFQKAAGARYQENQGGNYPQDITNNILRKRKAGMQRAVGALMLLIFLIFGLYNAAHTWRSFSRQMFSWRRLGAMILMIVVIGAIFVEVAIITRDDGVGGAMVLWVTLLAMLLLEASFKEPATGLPRWFGVMFMMGATLASAVVLEGSAFGRTPDWWEIAALVCIGPPVALLFIELLLWPFVLMHNEERQAGLALATLAAVPLMAIPVMVLGRSHHRYDMAGAKYAEAPTSVESEVRFDDGVEEERMKDVDTRKPLADGKPEPAAAQDAPRVRSYFPETMVWLPELHSDKDGKASVDVELPDSITTWRLDAWAHTRDGRLGQGRGSLRVWQPFFVELELPTALTQGDSAQIPVSLVNRHSEPLDVTLSASAEGALMMQGAPLGVTTLAPMERRVITIEVVAQRVGEGAVTFSAAVAGSKSKGDAVKRVVQVSPDGRVVRKSSSRLLNEAWTHEVLIPGDAIPDTSRVDVEISPGPVADAIKGMESMLREPYGCFEQTSSVNYPNIMILRALKKTKPSDWPGGAEAHARALEKARKFAQLGYQRILTFQKPGGGFALYPDKYDPTIMLTAYGVLQLKKMSEVTKVDPKVIERAERWLLSKQNASGSWPMYADRLAGGDWRASYEDVGQVRATSFVLLALARKPNTSQEFVSAREKAANHMLQHVDSVTAPDALALAANALLAVDKKKDARRVVDNIAGMVTRNGPDAYLTSTTRTWMGSTSGYANVETTAIAARAMLALNAHGELLSGIFRYLISAKSPYGGWGSTQATVWTLETLDALEPASAGPVEIGITLDGAMMPHANKRGEPGKVRVTSASLLSTEFFSQTAPGTHLLGIKPSDKSSASAQAITTYAVPWRSRNAVVEGAPFNIEVNAPSDFAFGQSTSVKVSVCNASQQQRAASIIELPSMPAAAIDNDTFEAMVQRDLIDAYEILPTHIRVYISGLGADQCKDFSYELTPMLRGDFSLTPASAWRFYTPTPRAFADGGDVSVR